MDNSPPGFSVHWILQARILSGLLFPPPGDLPDSGIEPTSPGSLALAGRFFRTRATWEIFVDINKSKLHYKKIGIVPSYKSSYQAFLHNIDNFPK